MSATAATAGSNRRLRVGMIGLGEIAQRAYLPVLATRRDIELALCTRNTDILEELAEAYRVERRYTEPAALLADTPDAVFVHAATGAHPELVAQVLEAGIPVYVDKPMAQNLDDARRLVELAREKNCSLYVGFNRRFAPAYRAVTEEEYSYVIMQKHRIGFPDEPRRVVFDDFIHVIDTLRFLLDDAVLTDIRAVRVTGELALVAITVVASGRSGIGLMNRDGGSSEEVLDVHGPGLRRTIRDLVEVVEDRDGRRTVHRLDEWTPVAVRRGFAAMCDFFLDAVRVGYRLDAGDALATHEMCEKVVQAVT